MKAEDQTVQSGATWIVTADRRSAHLLEGTRTPHGRLHLEQHASLEEEWDEQQHGRPSPRAGKSGHSYASPGHEDDERLHRFAKKVVEWLEHELQTRHVESVHIFAARRFLGALRQELTPKLQVSSALHALDLTHLSPGALAAHEAILAVSQE